jgi:hypothetical protein
MAARLSALGAGRPVSPRIFLVHTSVRGWVDTRAIVLLEGLGQLKKETNKFIGTWTSDLPACVVMPQPTALPRAPIRATIEEIIETAFTIVFVPRRYKGTPSATSLSVEAGSSTSTVALWVTGDNEKGSQCLGVYLGQPVPEGYKYGVLALQVVRVSNLRE